jgi:hypothetical protein
VDSGLTIQIHGTVYGPNSYPTPNGMTFWLNDGTDGIKIYSKHVYAGYTSLTDGDQVTVVGTLSDYYGSAEVDLSDTATLDTIYKTASGTPDTPVVILASAFSISTYGELVQVDNVDMSTATAGTWAIVAGKHYFTCHAGAVYLYIDSFTNDTMFHAAQPQGIYNVVGIGDDYSPTEFNLDPRSLRDFHLVQPDTTVGIKNIADLITAAIYPNPTSTVLNVTLSNTKDEPIVTELFDVTGQVVLSETKNLVNGTNNLQFNTANLTNGMYILEMHTAEKSLNTKIIVAK